MRVAVLTIALCAWAGAFVGPDVSGGWALALIGGGLFVLRRRWPWLAVVAFFATAAWRSAPAPAREAEALTASLFVMDSPEVVEAEAPWAPARELGFRVRALDVASGETWWVYGDVGDWRPGESHVGDGVRRDWPPSSWDGDTLARAHTTDATFALAASEPSEKTKDPKTKDPKMEAPWWARETARLAQWRASLGQRVYEATGQREGSAISAAIVIGDRRWLRRANVDALTRAGLVHVLSVSGFHVAWVAWLARWLCTVWLGPLRFLWAHDSRRLSAVAACVVAISYALLSGAELPALRSAAMWAVPLLGVAVGWRGDARDAFAATLLASIAVAPTLATTPGAAFSFFTVLVLMLRPEGATSRWKEALSVATWATVASAPWSAHYFATVPWLSVPYNLVAGPLAAAIVAVGVTWCALGALPALAWPLSAAGDALAFVAAQTPAWASIALALSGLEVTLACALILVARSLHARRAAPLIAALACTAFAAPCVSRIARDSVHFLPVGQGDAAVLFDGLRTTVVDTGGDYQGRHDPAARVLVPFLLRHRVWHVDDLVLTHAHPDHVGGAPTLLDRLQVDRVWANGPDSRHPAYLALQQRRALQPMSLANHPAGFTMLHPLADAAPHFAELGLNDNSLVLSHGEVLLTGDIEQLAELDLAPPTHVALKVAHHGSDTSTSAAFLAHAKPRFCIVSVGAENRFGHPSPRVLQRLHDAGCHTFRTDDDGLISLSAGCVHAHRRPEPDCLQVE